MDFLMVLIVLGVQRFLHFSGASYQWHWPQWYCPKMLGWLRTVLPSNPFFEWVLLLLPVFLVCIFIYALISMVFGFLLTWLFSAVLLWYCVNYPALEEEPTENDELTTAVNRAQQQVFAMIFWFLVGVMGMVFYKIVFDYHQYAVSDEEQETNQALSLLSAKVLAVMDWVPQRLLGLAFVVLSSFSQLCGDWLIFLKQGLSSSAHDLSSLAQNALNVSQAAASQNKAGLMVLLNRSLIVWLLTVLLFYIGSLF